MNEYSHRKIKPICFYLPQFYTFKENDEWWGKGFTEWRNVKNAQKFFDWQNQPQLPLNDYYYELNHNHHDTMMWQIKTAKKYDVYGFCFYHYWFKDGKRLLEIPVDKFLADKTLDINFCLSWANEPWTRAWDGGNKQVIMPQEYGERDEWEKHFYYLLPFFKDDRYIKIEGMPVMLIYRVELIDKIDLMIELWNELAQKEGLSGIKYIAQRTVYADMGKNRTSKIDLTIMYEPGFTEYSFNLRNRSFCKSPALFMNIEMQKVKCLIAKKLNITNAWWNTTILDYDLLWKYILKREILGNMIPGVFVDWDNTARRGKKGARVIKGATPLKFNNYMKLFIKKILNETEQDMIFINAWNEWAEGAHVEPDKNNGYGYLEALKDSLDNS